MSSGAKNSTIVRANRWRSVRLRPVAAAEAGPVVDAVFAGLSPHSRYLRFHSPVPRLSDPLRRQLVDLDGQRRAAVVAESVHPGGSTPIGLVRLADAGGGAADVAIAVVDAWQRRGIGRRLLRAAVELAETLGFTELCALVLPENQAVRRLIRRDYPQARLRPGGAAPENTAAGYTALEYTALEYTVPLGPAAWTVTEQDVLADLLHRGR